MIIATHFLAESVMMRYSLIVFCFCLALLSILCEATEYYVRPTEPTNSSCPGTPCLTLKQYMAHSDLYFKSNSEFRVVSGIHMLPNSPLKFSNVHNVSLIGDKRDTIPKLLLQEQLSLCKCKKRTYQSCGFCAGVFFQNATNITLENLSIVMMTPNYNRSLWNSAISIDASEAVCIRNISIVGNWSAGILIKDSLNVKTEVLSVHNPARYGVIIDNATGVSLQNAVMNGSGQLGIKLKGSSATTITEVTINSGNFGLKIADSNDTLVDSVEILYYAIRGIVITNGARGTCIVNTIIRKLPDRESNAVGMIRVSEHATDTTISNTSITCYNGFQNDSLGPDYDALESLHCRMRCKGVGIIVHNSNFTAVENVTIQCFKTGVIVWQSLFTSMKAMHLLYPLFTAVISRSSHSIISNLDISEAYYGVFIEYSTMISLENIRIVMVDVSINNYLERSAGIHLKNTTDTVVMNATIYCSFHVVTNSTYYRESTQLGCENGMYILGASNTTIQNTVVEFLERGIMTLFSEMISFINTTVSHPRLQGMSIWRSRDLKVWDTKVVKAALFGLSISDTAHSTVYNVLVENTGEKDIEATYWAMNIDSILFNATNRTVPCTTLLLSDDLFSSTGEIIYEAAIYCQKSYGVTLLNASNTTIVNATVWNSSGGIAITSSVLTVIRDCNLTNSFRAGILIANSTQTDISETIVANGDEYCINIRDGSTGTIISNTTMTMCSTGIYISQSMKAILVSISVTNTSLGCFLNDVESINIADLNITSKEMYSIGVAIFAAQNTSLSEVTVNAPKGTGLEVVNSNQTSIKNAILTARTGIIILYSWEVSITKVVLFETITFPMTIDNSHSCRISHIALIQSHFPVEIEIIASSNIVVADVDVNYHNSTEGLRILIGNSTIVHIRGAILRNGDYTQSGQGSTMKVSQSSNISISNTSFRDSDDRLCISRNVCFRRADFTTPIGTTSLPSAVNLQASQEVVFENCSFDNNGITGLKVLDTSFSFSGSVNFTNNRAIRGAAIILSQRSYMTITDNATVIFRNNTATLTGGAIYIDGYRDPLGEEYLYAYVEIELPVNYGALSTNFTETLQEFTLQMEQNYIVNRDNYYLCFLTARTLRRSLHFIHNSAGQGGDVLYGGNLRMECVTESYICTDTCLNLFQTISSITSATTSLSDISSDPSRVCLCDLNGTPNCSSVYDTHSLYPGQTISISAVVVGQDFGTVRGSVFAQFISVNPLLNETGSPQIKSGQVTQESSQLQCNVLNYTVMSSLSNETVTLVLTTSYVLVSQYVTDTEVSQAIADYHQVPSDGEFYYNGMVNQSLQHSPDALLEFPVYINITLLPCPPGFKFDTLSLKCDCSEVLQQLIDVQCSIEDQTIQRGGLVWVGPLEDENHTIVDVGVAQYCPLNYCTSKTVSLDLNFTQTDNQCNYNRSGTLCGGCQPGLSLALGSVKCLPCSNQYLALLLPFALAGVLLVLFIKLLDFTVASGTINGLVYYANIVKANESILFTSKGSSLLTLYISWLNLDFGIETCFVDGFTAYWKTWLQFVFPFYVWTIAGLIIILARRSRRVAKMMGNNSVPVLATLFLLSYAKLLRTIITALSYSVVEYSNRKKAVWSADGNLDYLGTQHIPLFIAALAVFLFLWLPYTLLLFFGQCLNKINVNLINRLMIRVKPLLDAHYGPLRDNHRYWFGVLLYTNEGHRTPALSTLTSN